MTENLLYKLEEKMMMLLGEVEELRKEIQKISKENASLKFERESHAKKLQDLISLLDAVNPLDANANNVTAISAGMIKPVLLEEQAAR